MRTGVQTAIDSIPAQTERQEAIGFDEAFTLHHRAVFATARAILRDAALAEEVTQDVFLKLYRHQDSAPGGELLRPWLLRVTLNEARNAIRTRNRSLTRHCL
jgi:DNA-directed RNA polymerase specialized sigma subunit, sigma24 homolog